MKVEGEREFEAPREVLWDVMNDPAKMAELMPGVQSFEIQDDAHWRANVKIPLGLGGLSMTIEFEKTEERPGEYSNRLPEKAPRTIATESRMCPSGLVTLGGPLCFVLLRKIFEVPKPTMKRPGPAASCTTRASIATCTGWRV